MRHVATLAGPRGSLPDSHRHGEGWSWTGCCSSVRDPIRRARVGGTLRPAPGPAAPTAPTAPTALRLPRLIQLTRLPRLPRPLPTRLTRPHTAPTGHTAHTAPHSHGSHGRLPAPMAHTASPLTRLRSPPPPPCPLCVYQSPKTGEREVRVIDKWEDQGSFSLLSRLAALQEPEEGQRSRLPPPAFQQSHGWEKGGARTTVHSLVHLTKHCRVLVPGTHGVGLVNQSSRLHRGQSSASGEQ